MFLIVVLTIYNEKYSNENDGRFPLTGGWRGSIPFV